MLTGWRKTLSKFFLIPHRTIVAIMGLIAITIAYTLRLALSMAITEMTVKPHSSSSNETVSIDKGLYCEPDGSSGSSDNDNYDDTGKYDWDQELQGIILSSFYWGYVLTHIPGGVLAVRYGGKLTLSIGMFTAAVFTLLTPVLVDWGDSTALIVSRVLVGLGEGIIYPSCGALLGAWTPANERSILATVVFSGGQVGSVVGTIVSGELLHSINWQSVFYFFGCMSLLWCLIFVFLCYSSPDTHPFISDAEREYLAKELIEKTNHKDLPLPPFRKILSSTPMLALICAQIGHNWGFFIMVTDLPKYMSDVLQFSIKENGIYSALPYVSMWIVAILTGFLSDFLISRKHISVTNARKLFTSIAAIGPGIFIVAASYAACNRGLVVALFTIGMGFMGTFYSGIKANNLDLSPNYAGVLVAFTNGIGGITGIIGPYIVGVITTNSTLEEWRIVFWIAFGVFILSILIYCTWASGEVQPWNFPPEKPEKVNTSNGTIDVKLKSNDINQFPNSK